MVNKLIAINLVGSLFLLLASGVGIYDTFRQVSQYGWTYEQTITIKGSTSTDSVNNYAQLFSALLVLILGLVFIINGNALTLPISTVSLDSGINFPNGEPKTWLIECSSSDDIVLVRLGEYSIEFPLSVVLKEDQS